MKGLSSMFGYSATAYVVPAAIIMTSKKVYPSLTSCNAADATAIGWSTYTATQASGCNALYTPASGNTSPLVVSTSASCTAPAATASTAIAANSTGYMLQQYYDYVAGCTGTPTKYRYTPLNVCIPSSTTKSPFTYSFVKYTATTVGTVTTFSGALYTAKDCTGTAIGTIIVGVSSASGCSSTSNAKDGYATYSLATTASPISTFSGVYGVEYSTQAGCQSATAATITAVGGWSTTCTPYYATDATPPSLTTYYSRYAVSSLPCTARGGQVQ